MEEFKKMEETEEFKEMEETEDLIGLYKLLQKYEINIFRWLKQSWVGKDKQESLLRLFGKLGLINKLKSYNMCKGNYNKKTITKITVVKDIFYDSKNNPTKLNDKGDSSDLTGICKENEKHLLVTTSKNLNKKNTQVGDLDIEKIVTYFRQYEDDGYTMSLCICVQDRKEFERMKKNIEKTSHVVKSELEKDDTIIIDWNDLNEAYHQFKINYGITPINKIINSNKTPLCLKMHQHLSVLKTLRMKDCEKKRILWGHIQRSGKSYIITGCIIEDSKDKDECNYLFITTAPNETIKQQRKVFDCIQLTDFNIIVLNGDNKKPVLTKKNIILCSTHFLRSKIDEKKITLTDKKRSIKKHLEQNNIKPKSKYTTEEIINLINEYSITDKEIIEDKPMPKIQWLSKMLFDMRFIDESHNGATTELAQKTLEIYGKDAFTVQITATYSKPINDYNIPKDCWILWDLEDIKLCKEIKKEGSIDRLVEKHGECIRDQISKFSLDNIINEYSKYPELWLLTDELSDETVKNILNRNKIEGHEHDGYSMKGVFLLDTQKYVMKEKTEMEPIFQSPTKVLDVFYRIFGKKEKNEFGDIYDPKYPRENVFIERIKNICNNPENKSRFIGEGDFHNEPMVIMAFLPQNNIDKISKATIKLLEENNVIPEYEIIGINSKTTNDPKQSIEDARIKARNSGKKGVLVFSGIMCSLGVSIDNCDIVLLLNESMGYDMIYQMMFRCMTEGKNKKCGFVIDLNIHRVIETSVINYASLIKPDLHPKEATKFILQQKLINLNGDHWMPSFGNDEKTKITALCDNVYDLYLSNTENALNNLLNRLLYKEILLTNEDQKMLNAMFSITPPTKIQEELIDKFLEKNDEEEKIKKGIEKIKVDNEDIDTTTETSNEDEKKEKQMNYMDILKHIIPLICLLTIHNEETSFIEMFKLIENNKYVYNIFIDQTKSWWGKSISSKFIEKFINIYIEYMKEKDDKEIKQIIRTVKELFTKNVKNTRKLSHLIDKYLIPQELEKKSNAEVSTKYWLRKNMLDTIPEDFWKSIKKVLETSAGKGGFVIDIIDRFMNGLKEVIPNEKKRYKTIVEECLYFSDINPTNIFICKLLIDPYNEYNLNYYEGDSLELDIKEKWNIDKFDLTGFNPPYNENPENSKDPHMKPVYQDWIYKFSKLSEILLFITPSKWFTSEDKDLKELRNYMKKTPIEFIKHYPQDNVFENVKIKGGVSYFMINKNFTGKLQFNNNIIDINKYDIIIEPQFYKLLTKIEPYLLENGNLSTLYCSQGTFINSKTEKHLTSNGEILCYVSQAKGFRKYISKKEITKNYNYWKIITPAAAFNGTSGFASFNILNDKEIHSRSYISFKINNEIEAKNLLSYLECKLVHILLSLRKQTHNLCNGKYFKWIPIVPLDQEWNNDKIHKYFNLDNKDIEFIKNLELDGSYKI
tara:strand:+ start:213 stop:4523 length:4311 start_codon:yes stop_codon:yes gene_type:complete